tara:strand:+ start:655 stop:936 length:282 start_codon:yes stop_codon:yes gene_type:complete
MSRKNIAQATATPKEKVSAGERKRDENSRSSILPTDLPHPPILSASRVGQWQWGSRYSTHFCRYRADSCVLSWGGSGSCKYSSRKREKGSGVR